MIPVFNERVTIEPLLARVRRASTLDLALRAGFARAKGDVVLVQDADLEYNPEEYPRLLRPILDGRADVVLSSRFLTGDEHRVLYFWHYVANRGLTLLPTFSPT